MITTEWDVVRRPADGETVGYLAPEGDLVLPLTLVGTPLGAARTAADATTLLVARGLSVLDGRWWCRLPDLLPRGILAAENPLPGWTWRAVVLVEVSPTACRVRPEWPAPAELSGQAELPVPVGQLLLAEPPE